MRRLGRAACSLGFALHLVPFLVLPLISCGAGESVTQAASSTPAYALFATWKAAEEKAGDFSLVGKVKFESALASTIIDCKKEGGESGTATVTSKAEYTATTYKVLEKKAASKVVSGEACNAAWDTQVNKTIKWAVEGDILTITGDDGSTNTLTRVK